MKNKRITMSSVECDVESNKPAQGLKISCEKTISTHKLS